MDGFGFWSGIDVSLTFTPAKSDSGIVFVRSDLAGNPKIPATVQYRIDGPRRTSLNANGAQVEMVEHVLAALAGLRIDNCEVHVDQPEMPGFDGSSQAFTDALSKTEIVQLESTRSTLVVTSPIRVTDGETWILAEPASSDQFELIYHLHYPCPAIGTQSYRSIISPETFATQISPARTFILAREAEQLRAQGLGQRVSYQDVLVFDEQGPINNQLRFSDECPRHKMLDMIGDFSLSGIDLIGKFTAHRSGHRLNSQMVTELLQRIVIHRPLPMSA